jgi:hypothetical protein
MLAPRGLLVFFSALWTPSRNACVRAVSDGNACPPVYETDAEWVNDAGVLGGQYRYTRLHGGGSPRVVWPNRLRRAPRRPGRRRPGNRSTRVERSRGTSASSNAGAGAGAGRGRGVLRAAGAGAGAGVGAGAGAGAVVWDFTDQPSAVADADPDPVADSASDAAAAPPPRCPRPRLRISPYCGAARPAFAPRATCAALAGNVAKRSSGAYPSDVSPSRFASVFLVLVGCSSSAPAAPGVWRIPYEPAAPGPSTSLDDASAEPSDQAAPGDDGAADAGSDSPDTAGPTVLSFDACAPNPPAGDFPLDVGAVLHRCQGCHGSPQRHGAPFQLLNYEDVIQPFVFGSATIPRWQRMYQVIQPGSVPRMPLGGPYLSDLEMQTLDNWFGACAPPVPEGTGADQDTAAAATDSGGGDAPGGADAAGD